MHIVQAVHHLMEICPGYDLREFSSISDEVKKLTSTHVLKDYCKAFISRFILLLISGVFSDIDEFY